MLTYVLEHSAQRGNELLTLIVLADHADENGVCWPSIERLAKLIRADARTARRCVRRLEKTGELKVAVGEGRGNSNRYQIQMQKTLELFPEEKGGKLPEGKTPPRTNRALNPDTAVSAEPSGTVIERKGAGQGKPSPVTECFKAYQRAIKDRYGAEYPPSASANGILAQLVKRLGAGPALEVTKAYVADGSGFYVARTHPLELLAKDGPSIWIRLQARTGGAEPAATKATAYFEYDGGELQEMADYPIAEHLQVAKQAARDYARKISAGKVRNVMVRIGREQRRFTLQELR